MSAYFQPEELHSVLDQLSRDPRTEEPRSKEFRETFSPFKHTHRDHRGRTGDGEARLSEISATAHSADKPTPLPSMTSVQEPSTPYPVGAGGAGADENRALATCNVEHIGKISAGERIKHWRRSSCQWPLSSAPVAEETRYAASVDQLEILTEIATSYSGSMQGDCIHANGDIEIHGVRVSPSKKPKIDPPAKKTKRGIKGSKAQKRNAKFQLSQVSSQNEDEEYQPINAKEFFFSKRRRSARIAALTKAGELAGT